MSALFHMNVFAFLPVFAIGAALGLLTVRARSLAPAVLLHFLTKATLLVSRPIGLWADNRLSPVWADVGAGLAVICFRATAAICWWLYRRKMPEP